MNIKDYIKDYIKKKIHKHRYFLLKYYDVLFVIGAFIVFLPLYYTTIYITAYLFN